MNLISQHYILHLPRIEEENRMTTELASLQEKIVDHPIAIIAQEMRNQSEQVSKEAEKALDEHAISLVDFLKRLTS
ncbi:hypothetical protein RND71_034533 [Anisodus tanguticus]|uniref:Uncharacterized protein n=1 Tax=Anisodus tanguticus TaxID=243964 RepID=A0AAE1R9R3_9SOLA|nr:hypothetical protein RND71_034533 [Anisodus tanguticus]